MVVSHGPTSRARRLFRDGLVDDELLKAADHEADLLLHPYIDVHHLELARLRLAGLDEQGQEMLAKLVVGMAPRRWRPRGPRSALRRHGVAQTREAHLRARGQADAYGDTDA
jgi:hypothetical protein